MRKERIRVGIVGCGLIGQRRAQLLPDEFELVSVFDPSSTASHKLIESIGQKVTATTSPSELIGASDIDAIIVATPHHLLRSYAIDSLSAGKHVFVEKPGGSSELDVLMIQEMANEVRRVVRFGFNHRFHPALLKCRELVRSGRYGGIVSIRAVYGHGGRLGYEKEWRADKQLSGGGELVDQGSHLIDLVQFLAGPVQLEYSHLPTSFWKMSVEDNAFLALKMTGGALAWLHASWTEWKNTFRFEVALDQARIDINGLGKSYGTETLTIYEMAPEMGPPAVLSEVFVGDDKSWSLELSEFGNAIDGTPDLGATPADTRAVWQIIEEAYRQ